MRELSKHFWIAAALTTGLAGYVFLLTIAWPVFDKGSSSSVLVRAARALIEWPFETSRFMPDWFDRTNLGHILACLWLVLAVLAGPTLFVALWTWSFMQILKLMREHTDTQPGTRG